MVSYEEFNNEHADDENMQIKEIYDVGDNTFELRFLSICSYLTENTNKWDGKWLLDMVDLINHHFGYLEEK